MADQALVPQAQPKAALVAGGNVAAIIPRNIEEVFRLAAAMVQSGMAPSSLKTPEQAMVAILAGAELGLPPFQSLQSFAIINNRPAIWGDGMVAVVRSNGFKINEWLDGADEGLTAWCTVTRPDNGEEITRSFSVADARKASLWGKAGPWQSNPKRMLQMRARGFACRDGAADVLRGFQLREEVEDYTDIPARGAPPAVRSDVRARLEARASSPAEGFNASQAEHAEAEFTEAGADLDSVLGGDTIPAHDAHTGEIIEQHLPGHADEPEDAGFPGDAPAADDDLDVEGWARDLINDDGLLIKTAADVDALFVDKEAGRRFERLKAESPTIAKELEAALNGKRKALKAREQAR